MATFISFSGLDHCDPDRFRIALRISATAAAAIVATILVPILSSNSQPNWQQRLEQTDRAVARAFQGVKNCVVRELEYGSYPSNVDDALRVILVRNCKRQYDAFFQACVATGEEAEICLGLSSRGPPLSSRSGSTDDTLLPHPIYFVPYARSPASPRPGTMNFCSFKP